MANYIYKDEFTDTPILLKKFKVTFSERKKYNPFKRTIVVESINDENAVEIVLAQFGGIKNITVNSVLEAKDEDNDQ